MRSKLVIALVAFTMLTVALPTAVTQVQPVNPDWEDPDGWGVSNYVTPEPNFGDEDKGTFDYDDTKMWQDPATLEVLDENGNDQIDAGEDRIYYDFVIDTDPAGVPGYTDESNNIAPGLWPEAIYMGYLGFWRDCNGDNFIGDLETLRMQYPFDETGEVKGIDTDLCPPPGEDTEPRDRLFNDGTQVKEFVPIGAGVRDIGQGDTDQQLCSDRNGGPSGQQTDEGSASGTPRADGDAFALQSATGDGGDNVLCDGNREDWIQDDHLKSWMQLLFPQSQPKPTGVFCSPYTGALPALLGDCPDGTHRDTNGHFRFVDGNVLGALSTQSFGLWPSQNQPGSSASAVSQEDPDPGNQCDKHADPVNEQEDGYGPYAGKTTEDGDSYNQGNAITNAEAWADQVNTGGDGPDEILPGCSPIPNWAYIDTPVLGPVAFPGHLAEDRFNSSESQNTMGTGPGILGQPFHWSPGSDDHCQLNEDPASWDGDDDADPVGGWSADDPTDLRAYYSPEDGGPHLNPTYRSIVSAVSWEIDHAVWEVTDNDPENEPKCTSSGGANTIENHSPTGQAAGLWGPGSVYSESALSTGTTFNPARHAGVGSTGDATDTNVCSRTTSEYHRSARCAAYLVYGFFIDVPNENPLIRSIYRTTAANGYADVSFGDGTADPTRLTPGPHDDTPADGNVFDPAGDGNFTAGTQGVYDATNPPGYSDADPWTQTIIGENPDDVLPAGNNAHTFGAEGCGPASSTEVGARGQSLALTEVPSTPEVFDADNGQNVSNPDIAVNGATGELEYDLPEQGNDDVDAPANDPANPANSYWLCDRGTWVVEAGNKETVRDANNELGFFDKPGCNLHVWSDTDGDGKINGSADAIGPNHELSCYSQVKVGDPYDLRDFECFDWDVTVDSYDTARSLPEDVYGAIFAGPGDSEDLYYDCDTPHTGDPAP